MIREEVPQWYPEQATARRTPQEPIEEVWFRHVRQRNIDRARAGVDDLERVHWYDGRRIQPSVHLRKPLRKNCTIDIKPYCQERD